MRALCPHNQVHPAMHTAQTCTQHKQQTPAPRRRRPNKKHNRKKRNRRLPLHSFWHLQLRKRSNIETLSVAARIVCVCSRSQNALYITMLAQAWSILHHPIFQSKHSACLAVVYYRITCNVRCIAQREHRKRLQHKQDR